MDIIQGLTNTALASHAPSGRNKGHILNSECGSNKSKVIKICTMTAFPVRSIYVKLPQEQNITHK